MRVDYETWVTAVDQALDGLTPDDCADVFGRNVLRVHRIAAFDAAAQSNLEMT